ncbi:hypothetical protein [Ruminiclostridium josui]|uniref:hypothetical protein n=1 Tax=Ruminiclostridium josui TaxID=1499 RepID=UPI000B0ACB49
MKIKIFTIISLIAAVLCYIFPFLTFKDYKSINGFYLITSLFKRKELHKLTENIQTYVFTSTSVPLLVTFLLFITAIALVVYYHFGKSSKALSGALGAVICAVISYGIQLSNSQTSITDFFGTILLELKTGDGNTIFKTSDITSQTGLGAKLLVIVSFVSLIFVAVLKIMDTRERNKGDNIQTPWTMAIKQFKRNKLAIVGLFLISFLIIICFYGPVFSKYPLLKTDIIMAKLKPGPGHLLGTDSSGRDILTRLMYGGRISITVALLPYCWKYFWVLL